MAKKATDATETDSPAVSGEVMSKTSAIRAALDAGIEVPSEATKYIFDTFGLVVSNETFSTTKSKLKRKVDTKPSSKPETKSAKTSGKIKVDATPAKPTKPAAKPAPASGNSIELAREVKKLVDQHGAETVREMAKLFAK